MNTTETQEAATQEKAVIIIVNGREKPFEKKKISFDEVVTLAFGSPNYETTVYTVTYRKGMPPKTEGSLVHGESVPVKAGMIFNVVRTDKS